MKFSTFLFAVFIFLIFGCQSAEKNTQMASAEVAYSDSVYDFLAIPKDGKLSAASKRALERNYAQTGEWYCQCKEFDLERDFAFEEGVVRRDPSAVISVEGVYHVYYSRSTGISKGFHSGDPEAKVFPWDKTEIWHATSTDGQVWKEQGRVVARGDAGTFDDRSVFTPEILVHDGKYILTYQTVKAPYVLRVKNQVGMATANSPEGPFKKLPEPILSPADNGEWLGEEDNHFKVKKQGDFDSHKVHDPCLLFFNDKFYLYYKGERMGEKITFGGREIRHGVAIADKLEGPYIKSEYNPISNSGHEVCVWHYDGGIASLITTDGPERNTIQWARDGVNFEIKSHVREMPHAIGLVRENNTGENPVRILNWGLTHKYASGDWQYIRRFECQRRRQD